MILLDIKQTIGPEQSKKNIEHSFFLPAGAEQLEINFSYEPKELADRDKARTYIQEGMEKYAPKPYAEGYGSWETYLPLVNLLTLSLDSPEGYVGCAHRHMPVQQHRLSEKSSDPGFLPCRISPGEWKAVVNVHAVVTDFCTYRLVVSAQEQKETGSTENGRKEGECL